MASDVAIIAGSGVLAFQAVGIDCYFATTSAEAGEQLRKVAQNHKVIFLSDVFAVELTDLLTRFMESAYPIVVPIPTDQGSNGYAVELLKEQCERALGVDILEHK